MSPERDKRFDYAANSNLVLPAKRPAHSRPEAGSDPKDGVQRYAFDMKEMGARAGIRRDDDRDKREGLKVAKEESVKKRKSVRFEDDVIDEIDYGKVD